MTLPSPTTEEGQDMSARIETGNWTVDEQHPKRRLHPATAALVDQFAQALADKLARAEEKYGYSDGWRDDSWEHECRRQLHHHATKGDPRDVAAYAAFCWHHGWSTSLPRAAPDDSAASVAFLDEAARYFESRPTGGEDAAHWSNVANAENCRRAAALLGALPAAPTESTPPVAAASPDRILALVEENERLQAKVTQAAEWFEEYADHHQAKGALDKASRNLERANYLRRSSALGGDQQ